VRRDLADGYVSAASARRDYGLDGRAAPARQRATRPKSQKAPARRR
jgi:hypothetical protein